MYIALVYDKRNVEGLHAAKDNIRTELTKRGCAEYSLPQMFELNQCRSTKMNSDCMKIENEKLNRLVEGRFWWALFTNQPKRYIIPDE